MDLGRLQPMDLKKVFEKMDSRDYSEMHGTAKWIHNFLENNLDQDYLFKAGRSSCLEVKLTVREDGEHFFMARTANTVGERLRELTGHGSSHFPLTVVSKLQNTNEVLTSRNSFEMTEICLKLEAKDEVLNRVNYALIDEFVIQLAKHGFKRVRDLEFDHLKPTDRIFKIWKPKCVHVELKDSLNSYWNRLSLLQDSHHLNGTIEEGVQKLQQHVPMIKIDAKFEELNDVLLPMILRQILQFHGNNVLKRLDLTVRPLLSVGEDDLEDELECQTGEIAAGVGILARFFIYPGRDYLTFASVESKNWLDQDQLKSIVSLTCLNWRRFEEAMDYLEVAEHFKYSAEYPKDDWKKILLQRFELISLGQPETDVIELPGFNIYHSAMDKTTQDVIIVQMTEHRILRRKNKANPGFSTMNNQQAARIQRSTTDLIRLHPASFSNIIPNQNQNRQYRNQQKQNYLINQMRNQLFSLQQLYLPTFPAAFQQPSRLHRIQQFGPPPLLLAGNGGSNLAPAALGPSSSSSGTVRANPSVNPTCGGSLVCVTPFCIHRS